MDTWKESIRTVKRMKEGENKITLKMVEKAIGKYFVFI